MTDSSYSSRRSRSLVVSQTSITPFGRKLKDSGYANDTQIQTAFKTQKETGKALSTILREVVGQELPPGLELAYKRQQLFELKIIYGVPSIDLDLEPIETPILSQLIEANLSVEVCNRYQLLPIAQNGDTLILGMVNPENLQALDDLSTSLKKKGLRQVQRRVFTVSDFELLMSRHLDHQAEVLSTRTSSEEAQATVAEIEEDVNVSVDDIDLDSIEEGKDDGDGGGSLESQARSADDAPVVKLVNQILVKALQEGVSDIHIEPQEEYLRVRFRKDGVLKLAFDKLPKKVIPSVTARFKIISDLNIAERRAPQDGRIRRIFKGRKIDFRVNTLPSRYGEKIVMRILDNSSTQLGLDKLISDPETLQGFREIIDRPFGLILVTGPTGSGKTTTLYSALAELNSPGINISTAEDPIEYTLPGVNQVQVIREKGMNFAAILRAFLRQDPDVILVGETRDLETAKTAIEASLTGHLVLTTLHTNDAAGAIVRLTEMGVEPFNISAALLGVLAQRLMRRVCTECRVAYSPSKEELARYGLVLSGDDAITFYKANTLDPKELQQRKAIGKEICSKCGGNGYKGRCGVYEFMRMNDRIAELINKDAPTDVIKEAAVETGMKTLLAYALMLAKQGQTTLEEVGRVVLTDKGLEAEMKARARSMNVCQGCGADLKLEWMDCPYCLTPKFG